MTRWGVGAGGLAWKHKDFEIHTKGGADIKVKGQVKPCVCLLGDCRVADRMIKTIVSRRFL